MKELTYEKYLEIKAMVENTISKIKADPKEISAKNYSLRLLSDIFNCDLHNHLSKAQIDFFIKIFSALLYKEKLLKNKKGESLEKLTNQVLNLTGFEITDSDQPTNWPIIRHSNTERFYVKSLS